MTYHWAKRLAAGVLSGGAMIWALACSHDTENLQFNGRSNTNAGGTSGSAGSGGDCEIEVPDNATACNRCARTECACEFQTCDDDASCSDCAEDPKSCASTNTNAAAFTACICSKCSDKCNNLPTCGTGGSGGAGGCGDGVQGTDEECDGHDFGDATCASALGAATAHGTLSCSAECKILTGGCAIPTCGDGVVNSPDEECDPGTQSKTPPTYGSWRNCKDYAQDPDADGELECTPDCKIDTSKCATPCGGLCDNNYCDGMHMICNPMSKTCTPAPMGIVYKLDDKNGCTMDMCEGGKPKHVVTGNCCANSFCHVEQPGMGGASFYGTPPINRIACGFTVGPNAPCAEALCQQNPDCCTKDYTADCKKAFEQICDRGDQAGAKYDCANSDCSHSICGPGKGLSNACSPCVERVCLAEPGCCNTQNESGWTQECVSLAGALCNLPINEGCN